jgi:hypothetical protein
MISAGSLARIAARHDSIQCSALRAGTTALMRGAPSSVVAGSATLIAASGASSKEASVSSGALVERHENRVLASGESSNQTTLIVSPPTTSRRAIRIAVGFEGRLPRSCRARARNALQR